MTKPFALSLAAITIAAVAGAACHKNPPAVASSTPPPAATAPNQPPAPPAPPAPPRATPAPERALSDAEIFARKSLEQLNAEHPLADAFFAYDENSLQDEARRILQQDAAWLAKWPGTQVRIEGYCDERGTAEYNLGLGERRAAAVKDYLQNLGVSDARIKIVSLGKESPFCHDDTESCYSQNRRGHFVITAK